MSDILDRLRQRQRRDEYAHVSGSGGCLPPTLYRDAADEIERLRACVQKLEQEVADYKDAADSEARELDRVTEEKRRLLIRVRELEHEINGRRQECHEVEQLLGRALGYPLINHTVCQDCHPVTGCTCGSPQVCVGEHAPATIAAEAAARVRELEAACSALTLRLDNAVCDANRKQITEDGRIVNATVTLKSYMERAHLVAALCRLFPSGKRQTDIPGWKPDWHGCVYIDLPSGQISYHYHDSHADIFDWLPEYTKPYDGHDKDEVHRRLAAISGPA